MDRGATILAKGSTLCTLPKRANLGLGFKGRCSRFCSLPCLDRLVNFGLQELLSFYRQLQAGRKSTRNLHSRGDPRQQTALSHADKCSDQQ